jgi:osmoprotectant transport system permease protein
VNELIRWSWVVDHTGELWELSIEHLQLTFLAVAIGFLISFPTAIFTYRHRRAYPPVVWVAGTLYTIPSIALFMWLVPITGLTTTTALIPLVTYTLLILIRNTMNGLEGVPEDVKEAARGMGYTSWQILWRIEVPLATPVIIAGVRIATVTTIGLVTVAAIVGYGGLGSLILTGLQRFFSTMTLVGAFLSMVLAVAADKLLLMLEGRLTPWASQRGETAGA